MSEQTTKVRMARCRVIRGPMEAIAVTVPVYELPLLRAMYGADNVVEEERLLAEGARDPEAELERLVQRYGDHPDAGVPWTHMVFGPDPARFRQAVLEAHEDLPQAGGEEAQPPEDRAPLESFTRDQLVEYLHALGVSPQARATKAELLQMARAAEQAAGARAA